MPPPFHCSRQAGAQARLEGVTETPKTRPAVEVAGAVVAARADGGPDRLVRGGQIYLAQQHCR